MEGGNPLDWLLRADSGRKPRKVNVDNLSRSSRDLSNMTLLRKVPSSRWIQGRTPSICIIGAGISGLRCAEILAEQGVRVTILEGRDRLGGRVHQKKQGNHLIDMGANWIHGTDHNPILTIAKETDTVTTSADTASATVDEVGKPLRPEKSEEISNHVWGIIADAFKLSEESETISSKTSLRDYFVKEVTGKDIPDEDKKAVLQMAEMWGAFIGSPWELQSLRYFWLEQTIDGENLFVASTYKAILERIARTAIGQTQIRLNTTVVSIRTGLQQSEAVQLTTSAATTDPLSFDGTVLTAPLGCLKAQTPRIIPSLPSRMRTAVNNLSYGNLEKVYLTFPAAFWDKGQDERYPIFTHFLHPIYAGAQNVDASIVEALSMSALPEGQAHPTLLFYIHGPFAKSVVENVQKLEPSEPLYLKTLAERFEPYFSRLPNYSSSETDCVPIAACATTWSVDDLAGRGSYTNFQIPQEENEQAVRDDQSSPELDKDIEALRHGCPERGLWLAGEHTAPFVALGTVTGAYWSGQAVAERVLHWFQGKEESASAPDELRDDEERRAATVQVGKGHETGIGGIVTQ